VYPDLSSSAVDLGLVDLGQTAGATVSVRNVGTAPAIFESIEVAGLGFVLSSPSVSRLESNAELGILVTFTPQHLGVHPGTLSARTTLDQLLEVPLSGTGR